MKISDLKDKIDLFSLSYQENDQGFYEETLKKVTSCFAKIEKVRISYDMSYQSWDNKNFKIPQVCLKFIVRHRPAFESLLDEVRQISCKWGMFKIQKPSLENHRHKGFLTLIGFYDGEDKGV